MIPRSASGMICGVRIWPLEDVFPNLFGIACAKHTSLKLTWSFQVAPLNGMQALLEWLMIGRWMSQPLSSGCCIQLEQDGKVKTNFGGSSPKEVYSLLNLSTVSRLAMMA